MKYNSLLLQVLTQRIQQSLGAQLVGLYVHGSIAFGCFQWQSSDIDLLIVTHSVPTEAQKRALIQVFLELTPLAPPKGLEMSAVLVQDCVHFRYPTPFSLHFSPMHLAACKKDLTEYCRNMHGVDRDLAAHFTVVRQVGIPLYGPPPRQIFGPVPRICYLDSIFRDVADASQEIIDNPVYFVLNLCRVLSYLQNGIVCSKETGGLWALKHLPECWHPLLQQCLTAYRTGSPPQLERRTLLLFCAVMQANIQRHQSKF